jgi:hypothetical protein
LARTIFFQLDIRDKDGPRQRGFLELDRLNRVDGLTERAYTVFRHRVGGLNRSQNQHRVSRPQRRSMEKR